MTNEELADKSAEEYFGKKTELVELWKVKSYKEAFLAGLKANRPEWHKVADGVLPKRNNELTDRSDLVITDKGIAHYNFRKQKWYVHNFECDMSFSEVVIAWCEIPTFTDKE